MIAMPLRSDRKDEIEVRWKRKCCYSFQPECLLRHLISKVRGAGGRIAGVGAQSFC